MKKVFIGMFMAAILLVMGCGKKENIADNSNAKETVLEEISDSETKEEESENMAEQEEEPAPEYEEFLYRADGSLLAGFNMPFEAANVEINENGENGENGYHIRLMSSNINPHTDKPYSITVFYFMGGDFLEQGKKNWNELKDNVENGYFDYDFNEIKFRRFITHEDSISTELGEFDYYTEKDGQIGRFDLMIENLCVEKAFIEYDGGIIEIFKNTETDMDDSLYRVHLDEILPTIINKLPYKEKQAEQLFGEAVSEMRINRDKALNIFKTIAKYDNPDAKFLTAYMYGSELDRNNRDFEKARTYYEELAEENPYAKICLADMYRYGNGIEEDKEKADMLYKEAIAAINEEKIEELPYANIAYNMLGGLYYSGKGVEKDRNKAFELYSRGEHLNDPAIYIELASMYFFGEAVEQNYDKCFELCEKAVEMKYDGAWDMAGYMYENGLGVKRDTNTALDYYEKSAESGSTSGLNHLAHMYYEGIGTKQDYAKAFEYYMCSADLENITAMKNVASMYEKGNGVDKDFNKAVEWRIKAGEEGDADSYSDAAILYLFEIKSEDSVERAMELFDKSVENDSISGIKNYGLLYETGQFWDKDIDKAKELYQKAADLGDEDAAERVKKLE